MLKIISSAIWLIFAISCAAQQKQDYHIQKVYHIASPGGWDYIAVNDGKIYQSHAAQVNILDASTGDSLGVIPNTAGVHGVAFANALHKGYTSNGRANNVTVFDLASNKVLGTVPTGENPDAIAWEPYTKTIITCNGRSKDLSIIDPVEDKLLATIPVGGKPETAVSDGKGRMFVNIEDKNEIVVVDLKARKVEQHWPLAPGTAPTGLAIDVRTNRLFAACDNKLLVVLDAASGRIVDKLPIGDGCDGDAFDEKRQMIITSNGEGTLTVIHENNANSFTVEGNYPTKRGARTIAIDQKTGLVFLPTADFQPAEQGARPRPVPGSFQILVVGR